MKTGWTHLNEDAPTLWHYLTLRYWNEPLAVSMGYRVAVIVTWSALTMCGLFLLSLLS